MYNRNNEALFPLDGYDEAVTAWVGERILEFVDNYLRLETHPLYQKNNAVIRKYSNDPQEDSERLYRQMVFNALIGNTDDHLKNFWMVHDREQGWRLSPAFDLIPDVGQRGEHVLFFDLGAYYPGRQAIESMGRKWGIRNAEIVSAQVFNAVAGWKEEFISNGVTETDLYRFKDIDSRFQIL